MGARVHRSHAARGIAAATRGRRRPRALRAWLLGAAFCLAAGAAGADGHAAHLPVCAACHGEDGNSSLPENPSLAGMSREYLLRQLKHFKGGQRASAVMQPIVATLDGKAMEALAAYFSEQTPAPGKAGDPALVERGQLIYDEGIVARAVPACSGCHGDDGSGDDKYPRVAGQQGDYAIAQIQAFRSGARVNDLKGVMSAVAKRMSDDDIRAVVAYMSGMNRE